MCGIVGLVYKDASRPCDADVVTRMRDIVAYRGPDDAGNYLDGPVGLGHRRLSIIDLGGGHQPLSDASGRYWIIFNGEIYNYRTVREQLAAKGHRFITHSDTEVIAAAYAERGADCVHLLNGMFAFAIWDTQARTLFLARDRMGVKPLYYAETPEALIFGSEVKSIFATGLVQARLRDEALGEYMLFRCVSGEDGLFAGIRSLPPGCTMTISDGRACIRRYWSPRPADGTRDDQSEGEALEAFGALLEDSVRLRLISDVPVGTFCSGGVDSSLVTALAARLKGDGVNTFSVGFDEPDYDESAYAKLVADKYGTTHHALKVGNQAFAELLPRMVWHNDEPLNFANSVQIFALSELTRRSVIVVLTGEGSDELFAGYPRYRLPSLGASFGTVPGPLRRLLGSLSSDHRVAKLNRAADASPDDRLIYNSSALPWDAVSSIAPDLAPPALAFRRSCLEETASLKLEPAARASLLDQETFLISILNRQDKMSMAASIESRVPFMDYRLVEFANRLPMSHKLRGGSGKWIVKELARRYLPAGIVDRRKSGFGVPLPQWFRASTGLGPLAEALPDMPGAASFDRAALRRIVTEHRAGGRDHSELIWTALNLALWRDAFRC